MSETSETAPEAGLKIATISGRQLQDRLMDCGIEASTQTLGQLVADQTEELWNWMEACPPETELDSNDGEDVDYANWIKTLPNFMEFVEGSDPEVSKIRLKQDFPAEPAAAPAETKPAETETKAAAPETTPAVPESLETKLATENRRLLASRNLIREANDLVLERTAEREAAALAVALAKAELKECQAELDLAVLELSKVIRDEKNGQGRLPFDDSPAKPADPPAATGQDKPSPKMTEPPAETPPGTPEKYWPISELGQKEIAKTVGKEAFAEAKAAADPIGLTENQLDKLRAADWLTVRNLEKAMRETRDWWTPLAARMDAAVVQRVISTLNAFRAVHPAIEPAAVA